MPVNEKEMENMKKEYGDKKGEQVYYAKENKDKDNNNEPDKKSSNDNNKSNTENKTNSAEPKKEEVKADSKEIDNKLEMDKLREENLTLKLQSMGANPKRIETIKKLIGSYDNDIKSLRKDLPELFYIREEKSAPKETTQTNKDKTSIPKNTMF